MPEMDLGHYCISILQECDSEQKASKAQELVFSWRAGQIIFSFSQEPPFRPGRPAKPELLPPSKMPKRGKAGSLSGRIALIHAICHIELNAIDLALDMVARFGKQMPQSFSDDWLTVADDEARHFLALQERLKELGSHYGALPAHDGLWESAQDTAENLAARLAVVPMVLEARGLDVTPMMIDRLESVEDNVSADILRMIYREEIGHVATGKRWFSYICGKNGWAEDKTFHKLVDQYFKGQLKPPFNHPARTEAGMPRHFYEGLL